MVRRKASCVGAAAPGVDQRGEVRHPGGAHRFPLGVAREQLDAALVHKRGVQLLASHTEGEAVRPAGMAYFAALVDAWRSCAYARRLPSNHEVEQLARNYREAFA